MNTQKLYEARKKKAYSQEDLANICGVSRQAVSKWETGQTVPDSNNLIAIARALEISVDYLLDHEVEHLKVGNEETSFYEYKSNVKILGVPLIHIHYSHKYMFTPYGLRRQRLRTAKGIIAIGDRSVGVLSIGLFSLGIFNIGLVGAGLIGLAIVQLAMFSFGIIAFGFSAVGIVSIGFYALGIIALAKDVAVGLFALGNNSIGLVASALKILFRNNYKVLKKKHHASF